ncbi:MAG: S8 family serine peptidase [Geitlerinemataceae cyanobacterium]
MPKTSIVDRLGETSLTEFNIARKLANQIVPVASSLVAATFLIPPAGLAVSIVSRETGTSVGEMGIDARRLHDEPYNLLGRKIAIGQVEIGRPAKFGLDKDTPPDRGTAPAGVFFRNSPAQSDTNLDSHAQNVAGVMISSAKAAPGVAPAARLYSAGAALDLGMNRQAQECLTSQHVALQNGNDVRAINFSFGEPLSLDPRPEAKLDGNALLTLCIDWSARVHNVLYSIAGNQGTGGIPIPTDNFNGVNVAFSRAQDGVFRYVDVSNLGSVFTGANRRLVGLETNLDGRSLVSLLAPGRNVDLLNQDGSVSQNTGTSFASPHVVATVALLQEYGDRQLSAGQPQWSLDARRHEVMKAVMLNSADKIQDGGDGLSQGMNRTIIDKSSKNWLESDAYSDRQIPLDGDMGTGHLNAFRAYQQFSPGQWKPSAPVPAIGWNYGEVATTEYRDYILEQPLQQGSFVAATLAWDRIVDLEDSNQNGDYDEGETFTDRGLNDLNLYLMEVSEEDTAQSLWSSVSSVDSVEHIFHEIPQTGRYKIRVEYRRQVNDDTQPYALAWWTVPGE